MKWGRRARAGASPLPGPAASRQARISLCEMGNHARVGGPPPPKGGRPLRGTGVLIFLLGNILGYILYPLYIYLEPPKLSFRLSSKYNIGLLFKSTFKKRLITPPRGGGAPLGVGPAG